MPEESEPMIIPVHYEDFVVWYDNGLIKSVHSGSKLIERSIKEISPHRRLTEMISVTGVFMRLVSGEEAFEIIGELRKNTSPGKRENPALYTKEASIALGLLSSADYAYYTLAQTGDESPEDRVYISLALGDASSHLYKIIWDESKFITILQKQIAKLPQPSDDITPSL